MFNWWFPFKASLSKTASWSGLPISNNHSSIWPSANSPVPCATLCARRPPPRTRLVCTRLGCTRSAAQGGEKYVKLDCLNSCFFDKRLFYIAESGHFVCVLMYLWFVSGCLGTGKTTFSVWYSFSAIMFFSQKRWFYLANPQPLWEWCILGSFLAALLWYVKQCRAISTQLQRSRDL